MVQSEIRDGVTWITCVCYDCTQDIGCFNNRNYGVEYTVLEFRQHMTERSMAYHAYLDHKISMELKSAHTKETEISGENGTSPGIPTFFDIDTGELADHEAFPGVARWSTLGRAINRGF